MKKSVKVLIIGIVISITGIVLSFLNVENEYLLIAVVGLCLMACAIGIQHNEK